MNEWPQHKMRAERRLFRKDGSSAAHVIHVNHVNHVYHVTRITWFTYITGWSDGRPYVRDVWTGTDGPSDGRETVGGEDGGTLLPSSTHRSSAVGRVGLPPPPPPGAILSKVARFIPW